MILSVLRFGILLAHCFFKAWLVKQDAPETHDPNKKGSSVHWGVKQSPQQTGFLMCSFSNHQRSDHIIRDSDRSCDSMI